jgi:protein SCO1
VRNRLLLLLLLPLLALTACGGNAEASFRGAVLHTPYVVPKTELTDMNGQPYSLVTDTTKRLTLLFFGYTNCPDECPATMAALASGMTRLDATDRADVAVVFVTTDPARDTGARLKQWLGRFDPTFLGVTGPLDTIKQVGESLGVPISKGKRLPSGGYDVTHGTQVLAIDGKNQVPVVWTLGTSGRQFADDIHHLLS